MIQFSKNYRYLRPTAEFSARPFEGVSEQDTIYDKIQVMEDRFTSAVRGSVFNLMNLCIMLVGVGAVITGVLAWSTPSYALVTLAAGGFLLFIFSSMLGAVAIAISCRWTVTIMNIEGQVRSQVMFNILKEGGMEEAEAKEFVEMVQAASIKSIETTLQKVKDESE